MEIEIKLLLDDADAQRLAARLGPPRRVLRQRNFYFDTADRALARRGWGLRIREETDAQTTVGWLTLKHAGAEVGDFSHRPEHERRLSPEEMRRLRHDPRALVVAARKLAPDAPLAADRDVVPIGELRNERREYELPGARRWTAELDCTTWPDRSRSWELELEVAAAGERGAARQALAALLADLGIAWRPGTESKLARLMRMLERG